MCIALKKCTSFTEDSPFCLLSEHKDTKFTITPPYEVFASLGADAIFHWKFSFGDWDDWNHFDEIYWGQTDSGKNIKDKYLTVKKDGKVSVNDKLSKEFQSRLGVIPNITQLECDLRFVLRNVTREDEAKFYGCKAIVYGVDYKDGPRRLVIQGKFCYHKKLPFSNSNKDRFQHVRNGVGLLVGYKLVLNVLSNLPHTI